MNTKPPSHEEVRQLLASFEGHTPAPWWVLEGKTLLHVETANMDDGKPCGMPVCSIPKKRLADANLCAAAPRMAAMLESILADNVRLRGELEKVRGKRAPVQGYIAGIPWDMHLRAYDAYVKRYGRQEALIEGGCRGGFGVSELNMFIPGWRKELDERDQLRARIGEKDERIAALEKDAAFWQGMYVRAKCGCLSLDCARHGAYDPADLDRIDAALNPQCSGTATGLDHQDST